LHYTVRNATDRASPSVARSWRAGLVVVTVTISVVLVVAGDRLHGGPAVLLVLGGTAGSLWVARLERRDALVPDWLIVSAIVLLAVVAVATPPKGSNDLWSYVMYGRVLSVHHANPWVQAPSRFASDPFLARVSLGWRSTRSVYGPVFVSFAAVVAMVARSSALVARLCIQGAMAGAVVGALLLIKRATRSNAAVLWLGLQPVVWMSGVNGGHNDSLVGLAVLGAAMLAHRRRATTAGIVLGLAALTKLTALLALVGIAPWMLTVHGRTEARRAVVACGAVVVAGIALAPASIGVLLSSNHNVSRASTWNLINTYLVPVHVRAHGGWSVDALIAAATIMVVALAALLALRLRRERDPYLPAAATTAAYTAAGSYVLPWYSMWSLPTFAAARETALATVGAAASGIVLASYQLPQSHPHSAWDPFFRGITTLAAPLPLFAAFVAAALFTVRRQQEGRGPGLLATA
jgi:Glycosyltransferase family 87